MSTDIDQWLDNNYDNLLVAETSAALLPFVKLIRDYIRKRDYSTVNYLLVNTDLQRISITVIVSLLRTTFGVSSVLPDYDATVQRACDSIRSRGENPERVLRGLINTEKPTIAQHEILQYMFQHAVVETITKE